MVARLNGISSSPRKGMGLGGDGGGSLAGGHVSAQIQTGSNVPPPCIDRHQQAETDVSVVHGGMTWRPQETVGMAPQLDVFVHDEQLEASKYPSLQSAFDAVVALCKQQRNAYAKSADRWDQERKEWRKTEGDLLAAVKAMHEAVDAETRAHNLDIQTMNALSERNHALEEAMGAAGSPPNGWKAWNTAGSPGHARLMRSENAGDGEGLKPALKHSHEGEISILTGKTVALQRYDPVTDSYRLSSGSGGLSSSATIILAQQVPLRPSQGSLSKSQEDEAELRKSNAQLLDQVGQLRHSNEKAWEEYKANAAASAAAAGKTHDDYPDQ